MAEEKKPEKTSSMCLARQGSETLKEDGADVTLRVVENLSHTYSRDEND
ncbi:MAG: hypothetical protein JRC86_02140 [Deltaproteobacteria bacterium]|nr:hypothetical protein [Deltaproteobacteria bacterium]